LHGLPGSALAGDSLLSNQPVIECTPAICRAKAGEIGLVRLPPPSNILAGRLLGRIRRQQSPPTDVWIVFRRIATADEAGREYDGGDYHMSP
jgi:hypothetical protein